MTNIADETDEASIGGSALNGGLGIEFERDGKKYKTVIANHCEQCAFYWRDGGIYDTCDHPDRQLVKQLCGADNRLHGVNLSWVKA